MIRAVFAERPEQLLFTCDGHAGGDKGSDIVCAAVSTAVELMRRILMPDAGEEKDGAVRFVFDRPQGKETKRDRKWWLDKCRKFAIFWEFFNDLAERYPERVSVTTM